MSNPDVVVIDYGVGNLLSVRRGLEHCGAKVAISSDHDMILRASRVILPGVGAFADGMAELQARGLDMVVKDVAARGIPLLGICLGMQMLLTQSEEFGLTKGLDLIPGNVMPIPSIDVGGSYQKIPHIGWNSLRPPAGKESWNGAILDGLKPGDAVYFVHSFVANPDDKQHRIAECVYGGHQISAVIGRGNVTGCQFHPEKSGKIGLKILRNFLAQ